MHVHPCLDCHCFVFMFKICNIHREMYICTVGCNVDMKSICVNDSQYLSKGSFIGISLVNQFFCQPAYLLIHFHELSLYYALLTRFSQIHSAFRETYFLLFLHKSHYNKSLILYTANTPNDIIFTMFDNYIYIYYIISPIQ